jgi:hypothetical protein
MQIGVVGFLERRMIFVCDISIICLGQETEKLTSYRNICFKPEMKLLIELPYFEIVYQLIHSHP